MFLLGWAWPAMCFWLVFGGCLAQAVRRRRRAKRERLRGKEPEGRAEEGVRDGPEGADEEEVWRRFEGGRGCCGGRRRVRERAEESNVQVGSSGGAGVSRQ